LGCGGPVLGEVAASLELLWCSLRGCRRLVSEAAAPTLFPPLPWAPRVGSGLPQGWGRSGAAGNIVGTFLNFTLAAEGCQQRFRTSGSGQLPLSRSKTGPCLTCIMLACFGRLRGGYGLAGFGGFTWGHRARHGPPPPRPAGKRFISILVGKPRRSVSGSFACVSNEACTGPLRTLGPQSSSPSKAFLSCLLAPRLRSLGSTIVTLGLCIKSQPPSSALYRSCLPYQGSVPGAIFTSTCRARFSLMAALSGYRLSPVLTRGRSAGSLVAWRPSVRRQRRGEGRMKRGRS